MLCALICITTIRRLRTLIDRLRIEVTLIARHNEIFVTRRGGNPQLSSAVSPGIKDSAVASTNFADTDITAPTPIAMARIGFSNTIASSLGKEIVPPNVETTRASGAHSKQSKLCKSGLNFAPNIVLFNVCHQQHLNIAALGNFPIKVDVLDMQLAAHPDRSQVKFVTNGLRTGFRTGFTRKKFILNQPKLIVRRR